MVMVDVDNKLPLYVQNDGAPFYFIGGAADYPHDGSSADFMAWLDHSSGQHFDPRRTLIFVQHGHGKPLPLSFLQADH